MTSSRGSEREAARPRIRTAAARPRVRAPAAGFTLTELLVVLALIALIGGMGAGAYQVSRRNYSLSATAGRVQGVLRGARNASLSTGIPAFVVVDPPGRTVTGHAFERVGEWSFDLPPDDPIAALGPGRHANHGATEVPGKVAKGLAFGGGAFLDCGAEARFDLRTAVHVEAWVRHEIERRVPPPSPSSGEGRRQTLRPRTARRAAVTSQPAATILEKAGSYSLGMAPDGALEGSIGEYRARTAPGAVSPGRWVHVALRFDAGGLVLSVDGVPRGTDPCGADGGTLRAQAPEVPAFAPVTTSAVTISSPARSFPGAIDEVKLSGGVEPLVYRIAETEEIIGWRKVLRFDGRGRLDPKHHAEGVRIVLVEADDGPGLGDERTGAGTTAVFVDYSLTFPEWLARQPDLTPLVQSEEEARLEAARSGARKVAIEVDRLGTVR